jgi:Putative esterase/Repeat of unknown function (DUF5648)
LTHAPGWRDHADATDALGDTVDSPFPIRLRYLILAILGFAAGDAAATVGVAVEYFNATLGHYFVTAEPDEAAALDAGTPSGWARTEYAFSVYPGGAAGALPVCRFFSATFAPKSSHFYTPYQAECDALKAGATWTYESVAFYLQLPSPDGTCGPGSAPIYRLYNNGLGGAPNHRFTAVRSIVDSMQAQGWTLEGSGSVGAFACGPPAPNGGSALVTVTATKLRVSYDIAIVVPAGYEANSDPIPVIYALDAQTRLQSLTNVMRETGARAILVGINDMGRRQIDFNVPGAWDYLPFLVNDLIPYVENHYRADPRRRVLSGHSTGGNFPFHVLYLEAPGKWSFAHYWSSEGAFWQQPDTIQAEEGWLNDAVGRSPFPVTLIFARGEIGADTNSTFVLALHDQVAARKYNGLRLLDLFYPALSHVPMDAPSFKDELGILLPK